MCLNVRNAAESTLYKGVWHGYEIQVVHNGLGFRCGYVRVPRGHPWFKADDVPVDVHGGVTYSNFGKACDTHAGHDEWWIGFDTCHGGDAPDPTLPLESPYPMPSYPGSEIRSQAYVLAECRALAKGAAKAEREIANLERGAARVKRLLASR